jgi:uncharacterized membrane protein
MNRLLRIFVTGLLAALPLLATLLILVWTVRLAVSWVGPDSFIGGALSAIGLGVTGSEVAGYALGIVVVVVAIFALGLLVEAGLERGLARIVDAVVGRIPVVRSIYDMLQRFIALVSRRDDDGLKSMSPVWCHFGGPGGAAVLALLSTPEPVDILGARFVGVVVPSAPVPVGGALIYVPEAWITPAEIGVEALTSIYVSMGVTSSQQLKAPGSRPPGT